MGRYCVALLVLAVSQTVGAATYTVTTMADAGAGSLRWAIEHANASASSDTIGFDSFLAGGVIRPLTKLPALTGYYGDTINGDVDDDGRPDFTLNGELLAGANDDGLRVNRPDSPTSLSARLLEAPLAPVVRGCLISGLAIVDFPAAGVVLLGRGGNIVQGCHIGVNRLGDVAAPNAIDGIYVNCDGNTIGGAGSKQRNVIVGAPGGDGAPSSYGLHLILSDTNTITGNYFGTNRDGTAALGHADCSVYLYSGTASQVGGGANTRNIFGGDIRAVKLYNASASRVQGNYFGLAPDGSTLISGPDPVRICIDLSGAAQDNRIGGTTAAARNVFASDSGLTTAIYIEATGAGNRVLGNDFGATADGSEQRPLAYGIEIMGHAGAPTIGGSQVGAANYFTTASRAVTARADNTTINGNSFGVLRSGTQLPIGDGVVAIAAKVFVTDNLFARATYGVYADFNGDARIYRNRFRGCDCAVAISATSRATLGNLGNASTTDDGGNIFRFTNDWHIRNYSSNRIRAEGNSFDTTVQSEVDAKIWDKLEDPALGRVDFIPLSGGVIPTGDIGPTALVLTGAAAIPSAMGAEIAFTLSAPADVTVTILNVAGRPIATLPTTTKPPGLQRILWTGHSLSGMRAPAGQYLIRVTARRADGAESAALATLFLR